MNLSIIIPAFNVEGYIGKCLNSIYSQDISETEYEIIVVDDGSTDNTLQVVQQICSLHSNLRMIHKTNGGVGSARNAGLEASKGDFALFVDADDWIVSGGGKLALESLKRHSEVDVVIFRCFLDDGEIELCRWNFPTGKSFRGMDLFSSHSFVRGSVWGGAYSMRFLNAHAIRFPENITHGEDTYFSLLVEMYAQNYLFENINLYTVYSRPGSACRTHDLDRVYRYKNNLSVISDYLQSRKELSVEQKSVMNYALFNVVCQAILQYLRLGKINPWRLKRKLELNKYLPINSEALSNRFLRSKIKLLNKSYMLFFLLYGLYLKKIKR